MKKLLLGSTALVTAGFMAGNAPMAADPIQLTITGYFQSFIVLGDWDSLPRTRTLSKDGVKPKEVLGSFKFKHRTDLLKQENEVHFNGRTKLDNGMVIGFRVELEGYTTSDQMDEYYIFAAGDWGRIEYGATDAVDQKMVYSAPSALRGFGFGTHNIFSGLAAGSLNNAGRVGGGPAATATTSGSASDANKISYFTPRFAGFQFGVSYTSEFQPGTNGDSCAATGGYSISYAVCPKNDQEQWEHGFHVAMNFLQKFNNVDLAIFAGYFHATTEVKGTWRGGKLDPNTGAPVRPDAFSANAGLRNANWNSWALGAQLGYQGFTLGGGMGRDNNGLKGDNETWWYTASLLYTSGPWAVSAGWWRGVRHEYRDMFVAGNQQADVAQNGKDKLDMFEVGGSYTLGPGVTLHSGVMWNRYDGQTRFEKADSWQFVFGSTFAY